MKHRVNLLRITLKDGSIVPAASLYVSEDLWKALSEQTRSTCPPAYEKAYGVLSSIAESELSAKSFDGISLDIEK